MENKQFIIELLSKDNVMLEIRKNLSQVLLVLPELNAIIGFEHHHPHHHLDVWEHTLLALSCSKNQFKTRIAILLHDVGKPFSYQRDGEVWHYRGHAEKSAEIASALLERLGFDTVFVNSVCKLIREHDTPLKKEIIEQNPDYAREIFEVQRCDSMAHNPAHNEKRIAYLNKVAKLLGYAALQ